MREKESYLESLMRRLTEISLDVDKISIFTGVGLMAVGAVTGWVAAWKLGLDLVLFGGLTLGLVSALTSERRGGLGARAAGPFSTATSG